MITPTNNISNIIAILPAAGVGYRMQNSLPKQYLTIGNKTIIEHATSIFLQQSCIRQVIIVISPKDRWFRQLPMASHSKVQIVIGGPTRTDSVMAALRYILPKEWWILIHDAVRPCLHQDDLQRLLAIRTHTKVGGILAIPVRDTIKYSYANSSFIDHTVKRNNLWHALTPQLFTYHLLKNSLEQTITKKTKITDESSALEHCGYHPLLVLGRADNIKVTNPEDLELARFFLR